VHRPRLLLAFGALAVAGLSCAAVLYVGRGGGSASAPSCGHPIPKGSSVPAAWDTAALFVSDVVLRGNPACGYDLSSRRLRATLSTRQWAHGALPIKPFVTQYPPTPIERASRDPNSPEAVYVFSRKVEELFQRDARGRWTIPLAVGLSAPDAGMGAYRLVLALEDGSWRVDRAVPVRLSS
jgi:hypothetical protein